MQSNSYNYNLSKGRIKNKEETIKVGPYELTMFRWKVAKFRYEIEKTKRPSKNNRLAGKK